MSAAVCYISHSWEWPDEYKNGKINCKMKNYVTNSDKIDVKSIHSYYFNK